MSNRLASEKSPYLLQHKDNPVDWWPWGDAAFAAARATDRPIFLSIGYATCHWCHVMEHESFEDAEVAQLLNDTFINIKVDREERPDVDSIYMSACQVATGHGGWPLSIMMTQDMRPFFVATYIPRTGRYGRDGMMQIIPHVAEMWQNNRSALENIADNFLGALRNASTLDLAEAELSAQVLDAAFGYHEQQYDSINGGFGHAPKFPSPERLRFLLRYWHRTGNTRALQMVEHTLQQMRRGGMFDQLGGGFHRYSTDSMWLLPHFEKMLYDQALLALVYLEAFQATGRQEYEQTVRSILEYVCRELQNTEGAYCTGEDADSEGVEGKYYVWSIDEVRSVLDPAVARLVIAAFNLTGTGNYIDEATRDRTGNNIPHRSPGDDLLDSSRLRVASRQLFDLRARRVRPLLDDKVLTDWNGLMIAALARCGTVLNDDDLIGRAVKCAQFIEAHMVPEPGRLLHRWREGEAAIAGMLDDYAYMIMGLLALHEATGEKNYCSWAMSLTQTVLAEFRDEKGGFYLTAQDSEELLMRPRQSFDSALPAGGAVMMMNLLRLGRITGKTELEAAGHDAIAAHSAGLRQYPDGFNAALSALDYALGPSTEVIVSGNRSIAETQEMLSALRGMYAPNAVILSRPVFGGSNQPAIHVCHGRTCDLPTQDTEAVIARLQSAMD
ncbi:MAG: thioredoxin domain-containing protein [Rhodothermaceae bacterium]|nr:thioredoxin domain-containing protein [Rhodothermaceae bacterium]MXX59703.1 thioredoxin domain-containing protein [Rhodothermaceae bacterium]MYD56982.1 thioredoxin domain-containing protein [Rhodothermaceae bacterium]MYJ56363.1 thioredoxin domain-containing protein [Rhodothermaceae bacterium]